MKRFFRTFVAAAGMGAILSAPADATTIYEGLFNGAPTGGNIPFTDGTTPGQLDASSLSDNGSSITGTEPINATIVVSVANAGITGTTANALAKLNSSGNAVVTATTDTSGAIGVVVLGAGASGNALIAKEGTVTCIFDGATTASDYVQISSTIGGDCHDAGSTYPTTGQVLGRVLNSNTGAGSYAMLLGPGTMGSLIGGGGSPGGSNTQAQFNNSGSFSGSSGLTLSNTKVTGLTFALGSDATGDLYYNSGNGVLTRLGIGSTNQVLTVSGGLPSWQTPSGGGGGGSCPSGFSGPTDGRCYWTVNPAVSATNCNSTTAACFSWTGLTGNEYEVKCAGVLGGSGNAPGIQMGDSSGWLTSSYEYDYIQTHSSSSSAAGSASVSGILLGGAPTSGNFTWGVSIRLHGLQLGVYKNADFISQTYVSSALYVQAGAGYDPDTNAITEIRLVDIQGTPASFSGTGAYCTLYAEPN